MNSCPNQASKCLHLDEPADFDVRLEPRNYHGSFRRCVLFLLTQFTTIARTRFELTVLVSERADY